MQKTFLSQVVEALRCQKVADGGLANLLLPASSLECYTRSSASCFKLSLPTEVSGHLEKWVWTEHTQKISLSSDIFFYVRSVPYLWPCDFIFLCHSFSLTVETNFKKSEVARDRRRTRKFLLCTLPGHKHIKLKADTVNDFATFIVGFVSFSHLKQVKIKKGNCLCSS